MSLATQRAQNKHPKKPTDPCRFGCGRTTLDCSYFGPPCEERLEIHRTFAGERTPVLDEERRADEDARVKTEHGIE